eukprot:scaffold24695_cov101-Isochrysis_galbana.AAC.1
MRLKNGARNAARGVFWVPRRGGGGGRPFLRIYPQLALGRCRGRILYLHAPATCRRLRPASRWEWNPGPPPRLEIGTCSSGTARGVTRCAPSSARSGPSKLGLCRSSARPGPSKLGLCRNSARTGRFKLGLSPSTGEASVVLRSIQK